MRVNPVAERARHASRYRAAAHRLRGKESTCHLCGKRIDPALKYPHPLSWSADHVTPISKGGDVLGVMHAAHLRCNLSRGNKDVHRVQVLQNSRVW